MEPKELAQAIIEEMKISGHAFWVDPKTHAEQHEFIAMIIKAQHARDARRERIKEKLAGSLVISTVLVMLGLIGAGTLQWLRNHL